MVLKNRDIGLILSYGFVFGLKFFTVKELPLHNSVEFNLIHPSQVHLNVIDIFKSAIDSILKVLLGLLSDNKRFVVFILILS